MSRSLVSHLVANGPALSAVSPLPICMICERESDRLFVVYSRPTIGAQTPFFPVLESLSASSSTINCCQICSQSLINQWNEYESKQIPIKNRFYYLNNKNAIFNSKSALIPNHKNQSNGLHNNPPEEVLDLSCNSSSTSSSFRSNARSDNNVKQWLNQSPVICYLCGEECPTAVSVLVRRTSNCPYFPNLASHPKPIGANPIDANGRIDSCESCHRFLIQQWDHFQRLSVPISERQYSLRTSVQNNDRNRVNRYSCVLCNTELSQTVQNVVISMSTLNESNTELKKLILSSAQEFIIGLGHNLEPGRVLTCISCFRELIKNNNPGPQMPPNSSIATDLKKPNLNEQFLCPLCHRIRSQLFYIQTNASPERKPFFPFLKDLVKPHEIDSLGRVKICNMCLPSLESQWEAFETALIPQNQRDYMLSSRSSPVTRSLSPPALKIVVSSPPPIQQSLVCEPLLTTVTTLSTQSHSTYCTTNLTKQYLNKNETKISGPMDEILSFLSGPLLKSTNCIVCGEFSMSGHTYQLLSSPRVPPLINHELGIYPFFPFLKKLIAINTANNCEDVDSAPVCTFCYHSLIGQWIAYNNSPFIEDKDPMRRTYNCRDYICFICGVTTIRQRIRSIVFKDFPFLREHSRPPGALTLSNGESVVTCLTCFDSLTLQWKDYERMKVPIEMRKYNWITVAPPNRDSVNELPLPLVLKMNENISPPSVMSTPLLAKGMPGMSALNTSNSMTTANKNSSFSDALRKLAKQSFDQTLGNESAHNSVLGLSVPHQKMGFQNTYQSPTIRPSPPIVTIAPIAAHQSIDRSNDLRKQQIVDNNQSFFEHRIVADSSKDALLYSHSQRTSPIVQVRPSPSRLAHSECLSSTGNHTAVQNSLSNRSSGFQPYRSGFEESPTGGLPSTGAPTLPSHLLPYEALAFPYHPFLSHSASIAGTAGHLSNAVPHPSAPYRLADNYYLDRFGLFRGSSLAHSGSSGLSAGVPTGGSGGVGPTSNGSAGNGSSVPFNLVRYSELMSSQTERLINDERHRLLNQTLSQSLYKPSAQNIDNPILHPNHGSNSSNNNINNNLNERLIDTTTTTTTIGEPILATNHSNHGVKQDFSVNHLSSGSILNGTPMGRDMGSSSGSGAVNLGRKHSMANISAVKPLNLSSNCEQTVNSSSEQIWRPQSDDRREQNNSSAMSGAGLPVVDLHMEQYSRRSNALLIDETLKSNKNFHRVNSFEGLNTDRNISSSASSSGKSLSSECNTNEGLHSRILDNHLERSVVTDNHMFFNTSGRLARNEVISGCDHQKSPNRSNNNNNNNNGDDEDDRQEKVISKLDLQEIRLKQKRVNKYLDHHQLSSDEESDLLSENDDDLEDKYRIILSKRMPLELDTSHEKMDFLSIFKLTTHKRKSQLEFNKFVKRRKILRQDLEESPEPTICLPKAADQLISRLSTEENKENPDFDSLLTASHISPDSVAAEEKKPEVKLHFMSTLDLCEQNSSEKKRNVELVWTGIMNERLDRTKRDKCWSKVINNLDDQTLHKWLISLQTNCRPNSGFAFGEELESNGFNGFTIGGSNSKPAINSLNNSSRSQRKVILTFNNNNNYNNYNTNNKQTNDNFDRKNNSIHSMVNSRSGIHSNKDFAQEFHESVLAETTKQQQSRHVVTTTGAVEPTHLTSVADISLSSSAYKWPGIEAVMEAYDRHSYERNQEKDFLQERTHHLKNKLQDNNREAEYLSQKMANLLQAKSHLDEERQRYQTTLDALKTCLRQMR